MTPAKYCALFIVSLTSNGSLTSCLLAEFNAINQNTPKCLQFNIDPSKSLED